MTAPFARIGPCASCPFSTWPDAIRLGRDRRAEIAESLQDDFTVFYCHKTVNYDGDEPDTSDAALCGGAEVLRWRDGTQSVMSRVAAAFEHRTAEDYDTSRVPWAGLQDWAATAPGSYKEQP